DNMYDDFLEGTLFHNPETSNKKEEIKAKIKSKILNGEIADNLSGFKYTLSELCRPLIFTEVVKELENKGLIKRSGELNYQSVNIHDCKKYTIKRIR
ncbi:MAG: hypothetical protein NTY07_21695, partial [Bacteroidia bacterium]|nr:hypothetical protein [Bacteroidia bacterium]